MLKQFQGESKNKKRHGLTIVTMPIAVDSDPWDADSDTAAPDVATTTQPAHFQIAKSAQEVEEMLNDRRSLIDDLDELIRVANADKVRLLADIETLEGFRLQLERASERERKRRQQQEETLPMLVVAGTTTVAEKEKEEAGVALAWGETAPESEPEPELNIGGYKPVIKNMSKYAQMWICRT